MSILGNPITLGGGSKVPDFTYTGNAEWYNEEKTILKLKTSGVLTLSKTCTADVFCVGGGGAGANGQALSVSNGGGGGGGGYTTTNRKVFSKGVEYSAIIGDGGTVYSGSNAYQHKNGDGGATSINGVIANGGQAAPIAGNTGQQGGNGGSGGGAGGWSRDEYQASFGGNGGSNGSSGISNRDGKTAGSGQGSTTKAFGEDSGICYGAGGGGGGYDKNATHSGAIWLQNGPGFGGEDGGGNGGAGIFNPNNAKLSTSGEANTGAGGGGGGNTYNNNYGDPSEVSGVGKVGLGATGGSGVILIRFV